MEKQEKPTYAEFIKRSHINSYSEFVEISKTVNDAMKKKQEEKEKEE